MKVRIQAALLAVAALALVLISSLVAGGGATRTLAADPTPTPVTTGNIPLLAINPAICVMLLGKSTTACDDFNGTSVSGLPPGETSGHIQMATIDQFTGNDNGILEPADFNGIDLDGNQVHQQDDYLSTGTGQGSLWIIAFVHSQAPVTFHTNVGVFVPANSPFADSPGPHPQADEVGSTWVCDNIANGTPGTLEDPDCGGSLLPGSPPPDGVVVARLRARYGTNIADLGPGAVTVRQSITDVATINFRVVGEPRELQFTTLESSIQTGITDPEAECPLPTSAPGFLATLSNPHKAIVLAKALDINGDSITGAIITWDPAFASVPVVPATIPPTSHKIITRDTISAGMANPLTPTLDLGSFGFGAPNVICGTTDPGTVTVKAAISKIVTIISPPPKLDPGAREISETIDIKVVGDPASVSAVAAPAAINCDGTTTSTVTATVLDANGEPVATGNEVKFDVQVLGSANPIIGKTNDKGVATSAITPLAVGSTGVPVTVTIGDLSTSLLIDCTTGGAPAGGGAPPPGGAAGGAAGGGTGVITGPNTGTGDALARSGSGLSGWAYALLALGAVALSAGSMLAAARARNR